MTKPLSIPRPLVRVNQWTVFLSVILTWATGFYWILLLPLIANLCGVLFGINPIIYLSKGFLKKDHSQYIPEDVAQQRFNSVIATLCLTLGFLGYVFGINVLAYTFTVLVVAVASFVAILGFCIGCFIHFQLNQFKYRLSSIKRD